MEDGNRILNAEQGDIEERTGKQSSSIYLQARRRVHANSQPAECFSASLLGEAILILEEGIE